MSLRRKDAFECKGMASVQGEHYFKKEYCSSSGSEQTEYNQPQNNLFTLVALNRFIFFSFIALESHQVLGGKKDKK